MLRSDGNRRSSRYCGRTEEQRCAQSVATAALHKVIASKKSSSGAHCIELHWDMALGAPTHTSAEGHPAADFAVLAPVWLSLTQVAALADHLSATLSPSRRRTGDAGRRPQGTADAGRRVDTARAGGPHE